MILHKLSLFGQTLLLHPICNLTMQGIKVVYLNFANVTTQTCNHWVIVFLGMT